MCLYSEHEGGDNIFIDWKVLFLSSRNDSLWLCTRSIFPLWLKNHEHFYKRPCKKRRLGEAGYYGARDMCKAQLPRTRNQSAVQNGGGSGHPVWEVSHPSWDPENSWDKHLKFLKFLAVRGFCKLVETYHISGPWGWHAMSTLVRMSSPKVMLEMSYRLHLPTLNHNVISMVSYHHLLQKMATALFQWY